MKTEIKLITPELAKQMLKANGMNRPLGERHVSALKQQMLDGKWLFDGSPIKFNSAGQLLDGQHRLTALIQSNKSFEFVVISGIPTESFKVMDTGKNRTAADSVAINGITDSVLISDVSRSILNYISHQKLTKRGRGKFISNSDVYDFASQNIDRISKSNDFIKKFKKPIIPKSKLIAFHLLFNEINVSDSDVFISKLCTGLDLEAKSPIYVLRQKLIADLGSKKKMSTDQRYALVAKAWKMFRNKQESSVMQIPDDVTFTIA